jgi:hypothetical protein
MIKIGDIIINVYSGDGHNQAQYDIIKNYDNGTESRINIGQNDLEILLGALNTIVKQNEFVRK